MGDYSRPDSVTAAQKQRDWLISQGISYKEATELMFGGSGTAPQPELPADNIIMWNSEDLNALQLARDTQAAAQEVEMPDIQDDTWYAKIFKAAGWAKDVGMEAAAGLRQAKTNLQQKISDKQARALAAVKDKGSDALAIGFGLADPFIRSQQVLFDWLAGEGLKDAFVDNIFNPYILDEETGEVYARTPWFTTMEYLWGKMSGADDMPDMERVKQVNEMYLNSGIKEFNEVVDAWAGGANPLAEDPDGTKAALGALKMDEFYRQLNDKGVAGKIAMGALSTLYAGGEVFVDPLFIAADAPVLAVKGAQKALPTSVKAAAKARVAQRIQTLDKAEEAIRASAEHIEATLRAHNANPTPESMQRLKQAAYNHAKNLTHKENLADPGAFEQITYGSVHRRKPEAIPLTERTMLDEELVPLSPTRGIRKDRIIGELQARVDELVKAEGLPSKMNPDAKVRYKELDKIRKKIRDMDEDNIPDVITIRGEQIRTRTVDELAAELRAQRVQALKDEYPPIHDYGDDDLFAQAGRLVGADAGEDAGDALRVMINGGEVDDVTISSPSITGRINASSSMAPGVTSDGLIDMRQINRTLKEWNTKRKNLHLELPLKFDDTALPKPSFKERLADLYASAPEIFAKALYPNSMRFKTPGFLKALAFPLREPQRVIEGMDPGAWGKWRNAIRGMEGEIDRFNNLFHHELERCGALTTSKHPRIRSLVMESDEVKYTVNAGESERLFWALNVVEDSEEFSKIADELSEEQLQAVRNIREVLDFAAAKQGLTNSDKYLEGFIHHMFDRKLFNKGAVPPEMRDLSPQSSVFVAHLLDRTGKAGFRPDAVAALDVYTRAMGRKLWLEPALKQLQDGAELVSKQRGNRWYKTYVDDFVASVRGERSFLGHKVDRFFGDVAASGGPAYSAGGLSRKLGALTGLMYTSLLSGNLRYPIMSIATALNTTGAKFGMFRTVRGLFSSATAPGQALINRTGVRKHWAQILEAEGAVQRLTDKITKLRFPGRPSVQDTEAFIRGMTMHGALDEIGKKLGYVNMEELYQSPHANRAIMDAIRTTEEVNHYFGAGSRPPIFDRVSRSAGRLATQFLSFAPKQTEQLWALYKENPGYIMRYMMLAGWLQRMAAEDLGVDISEYLGFGYRPKGFEDITSPGVELLWEFTRWHTTMNEYLFGDGNLDDVDSRTTKLLSAADNMVPLKIGIEQAAKQIEAFETGEQKTRRGALTRKLDLEFGEKGQRGDIMAVIMQLRSMQDVATERARQRVQQVEKDYLYETEALLRTFIESVRDDEPEKYNEAAQRLIDMGYPLAADATKLVRKIEAENIEWWLRTLDDNKKLLPNVLDIMQQEGLLPVARLPKEELGQ